MCHMFDVLPKNLFLFVNQSNRTIVRFIETQSNLCRTTSVDQKEIDSNSVPLKFEDIVDKKIYDKMRPPKPGGKCYRFFTKVIVSTSRLW